MLNMTYRLARGSDEWYAAAVFSQDDLNAAGATRTYTPEEMEQLAAEIQDILLENGYWDALSAAIERMEETSGSGEEPDSCPPDADGDWDGQGECPAGRTTDGYWCTRPAGHEGPHHAHGNLGECYQIWEE